MFTLRQAVVDASKKVVSDRARRQIKMGMIEVRAQFLARLRAVPGVLIIGTMRGGTSSLFKYLDSHPGTAAALRKEVQFFSRYWDRGSDWYHAHFPITRSRLAFEATPDYLFHPFAAERAARTVPNAKLIVLLREPGARARSHYNHMVRLGFERRSFTRAFEEEEGLVRQALARLDENRCSWQPLLFRHSYLCRGYYACQLEKWLAFFPATSFLVLSSEELYDRPLEVLDAIADFLGITPGRFGAVERNYSRIAQVEENLRRCEGSEPPIPTWVLARFQEENRRLADLLRYRLPAAKFPRWLNGSTRGRAPTGYLSRQDNQCGPAS